MKRPFRLFSLIILLLSGGCGGKSETEPHELTEAQKKEFRESWGSSAEVGAIPHPKSVQVAAGLAPLAYIAEQSGEVWIGDDKGHQWGPAAVAPRTVIRISADTGIAVGSTRLERGPLPKERLYTINIGTPPDEGWKNATVGGPKRPPR